MLLGLISLAIMYAHAASVASSTQATTMQPAFLSTGLGGIILGQIGKIHWIHPVRSAWFGDLMWPPLPIGFEADESEFQFDGILSQRPGSIRHFILDLATNKGESPQVFPVVFDTGSETVWLASAQLGARLQPPRPGYILPDGVPPLRLAKGDVEYVATKASCEFWAMENMTISSSAHPWESPLCVTEKTDVAMRAITGVLGSDLESPFVKAHRVFWLIPQEYPRVGLVLRDRLLPEWVCANELSFAYVPMLTNTWLTGGSVRVGDHPARSLSARVDTGVNRIYLPKPLWDEFNSTLVENGIKIEKASVASEYFSSQCENTARLPSIFLALGEFSFELKPEHYVQHYPATRQCTFQIYNMPDPKDTEALIGAPLLTRVVSFWDSVKRRMGFCLPKV